MKKLFCILFIFSISCGAQADNFCSKRESFYKRKKLALVDAFKESDLYQVDIVFLGEPHKNFANEIYPQVLEHLKANNFLPDCYLLEADQKESLVNSLKELNSLPPTSVLPSLRSKLFPGLYDIVMRMHALGLKVFAVDNHEFADENEIAWLNTRDQHMSKEIEALTLSNHCRQILYPIGALHVSSSDQSERLNLRTRLERKGHKVFAINIDLKGQHQQLPGIVGWNGLPIPAAISTSWLPSYKNHDVNSIQKSAKDDFACLKNPTLPKLNFVTVPNESDIFGIAFDSTLKKSVGRMSDFEMNLSFACQSENCMNENKRIESHLETIGLKFY